MAESPSRRLADISEEELREAVKEMLAKLKISGSAIGIKGHDLWGAILGEWEKAKQSAVTHEED